MREPDSRLEADLCLRLQTPPSRLDEWGDLIDRQIILTHLHNESLRCPGCGGYIDETTDRSQAQRVHDDVVCHRCAALDAHRKLLADRERDKPGLLLWAETIPRPPDDDM